MKLNIITHIWNEEFLLPWWIRHHQDLADSVTVFDYGSTDRSIEIIKDMAPTWNVLRSRNRSFNPELVDLEVEKHEKKILGWKIALNTSEFLVGDVRTYLATNAQKSAFRIPGVTMVDIQPGREIDYSEKLIDLKPWGIDDWKWAHLLGKSKLDFNTGNLPLAHFNPWRRGRLIHNKESGQYHVGRHSWRLATDGEILTCRVLWFGLSPWNIESRQRRELQLTRTAHLSAKFGTGQPISITDWDAAHQQLIAHSGSPYETLLKNQDELAEVSLCARNYLFEQIELQKRGFLESNALKVAHLAESIKNLARYRFRI